jgi:hypothetical protein
MAPIIEENIGRFWRGTEYATMIRAPEKTPALPTPAMARPTIKALLLGATPQTREPISKMEMASRKMYLMEKNE